MDPPSDLFAVESPEVQHLEIDWNRDSPSLSQSINFPIKVGGLDISFYFLVYCSLTIQASPFQRCNLIILLFIHMNVLERKTNGGADSEGSA